MLSASLEVAELKKLFENETISRKVAEEEIDNLKNQLAQWKRSEVMICLKSLLIILYILIVVCRLLIMLFVMS